MKRLIHVWVSPSDHSPYGIVGMLLDVNQEFIQKQLDRFELYGKLKKEDINLAYIEYWGGCSPAVDIYALNEDWDDDLSEEMQSGGLIQLSEEQIKAIESVEDEIRLDTYRIVIREDGFHISAYGKHNDLRYETEAISAGDLKELQTELSDDPS